MNNREWLESLTDEELAEFLAHAHCKICIHQNVLGCLDKHECEPGVLEWLRQEREEKQEKEVYAVMKSDYVHNSIKEVISTEEVIATEGIFFDKKEAEEHAKTLGKEYKVFRIQ